jgi:superfamily I DNA and/or RNA helicase
MGLCDKEKPYSFDVRLAECGAKRGDKGLKAVMSKVDVVAATCIGCGMGPLDKITFPFIVVDEAAQVIEPAVTLPLGKGAIQAVMVGDQCQLPATVLSQHAQKGGLEISMFDRLLSMGMEYQLLKEQYRMHPQISAFPSWRFYRGELKNGVKESARQRPEGVPVTGPLAFLHVEACEQSAGASKKNVGEAACAGWLVDRVLRAFSTQIGSSAGEEIGVILRTQRRSQKSVACSHGKRRTRCRFHRSMPFRVVRRTSSS